MWNWYSGDGAQPPAVASDSAGAGSVSVAELTEQLAQTQQLMVQLKDLIREKDNDLRKKDQQLKEEKESSESKVSKVKLQSKAKVASLTAQLEELKKQLASPEAHVRKPENKKGSGEGEQENASASRGKILVLRKRVEELESQLASKNEALQKKDAELEAQRLHGSDMDAMLAAKEKKLAEKEAYIVDLQMAAASNLSQGDHSESPLPTQDTNQDLQILIQNLNRKVGESEEKYSLLREQSESLKALLNKEKTEFLEKEAMYTENIRVYQNMILEKEKEMKELSQKHEQEIFKLAAKSDATADLHQLLKALKQKLHEEEEVLSGKNQVIDVLQKELDNKDQQVTEMNEKCKRLLSEKENLQSKLDAEKHVMRAQLRDMMEKHETEVRTIHDHHTNVLRDIQETHRTEIQELQKQLQGLASPGQASPGAADIADTQIIKLQGEVKLKKEEASKSDAKFLKMKAWSKSRIRQLEEELKIAEGKKQEVSQLNVRIVELEEDKRELEMKLESVADLQALNEQLLAKLVTYEEQHRKLQADLEQVAKRADSQTSEGSVDEMQNQLLEWNDMSAESDITPEREETSVMALRMAQIEEEREAMDSGQVELEEELSTARGLGKLRTPQRKGSRGAAKLQGEFHYGNKSFEEQNLTTESVDSIEGENMGGLRVVVEELEMERNQLQEQIMTLEERCQELEDRLQLQLRIESLQSENERLQSQISQLRQQQSHDLEKHYDLVSTLNEQLKSLTNRNAFLENAASEKDQTILEISSKLDQLGAVRKSLQEKEAQNKELWEKLDQCENELEEVTKKLRTIEGENSALKMSNSDLTEKVSAFKEKVLMQDTSLEKLQVDLDQTNDDLDRLNTSHLEERSQLIYDLQRCEREVDVLKEVLQDKDKEMSSLSATLTEYSEQISILKETIDFKDEQMREMSDALVRIEREHHLFKEAQTSDVHETSAKISSLTEQLGEMDLELINAKSLNENKSKEVEELIRQINENGITIKNLRQEIQTQSVTHNNHVTECSTQIASLKEQMNASAVRLNEMEIKYKKEIENLRLQLNTDDSEKARLALLLEGQSKKEQSFVSELKAAKEQHSTLVSDTQKKAEKIEQILKNLAEQKSICNKLNKELGERQEELSSLKKEHEKLAVERDGLAKALKENTNECRRQIAEKSEIIKTLDLEKKELLAQCKMLETSISNKESTLQLQTSSAEALVKKVQDLEVQNQHLFNEKEDLLMQINHKDSEMANLNQTLKDFQAKSAEVEKNLREQQERHAGLLQEKEDLLAKIERISAQSLQNFSDLEEQTKQCQSFRDLLNQEQESSQKLHFQIQALEQDLKKAQNKVLEKDDVLKATNSDYKAACENLQQNVDQNTLLQKQVEELNKAVKHERGVLQEKDLLLTTLHTQLEHITSNVEKLQTEKQALKETNVKLTEQIEGLSTANIKLQVELNSKGTENISLIERMEDRNKEIEKLIQERDSSLLSVSNLESQCFVLQSQIVESKVLIESLTQQVTTLKSENDQMNSSIQLLNTTLSDKSAEVNVLSSHLSEQGHSILSLKDQIDTIHLEKQSLLCTLEEKDTLLLQKEELIHQVEQKLEGEGHYLQTISALQNELQITITNCALEQQKVKNQELDIQKLMQQMQLLKDKSEEAGLLKTQLSEHMGTISDLYSQNKILSNKVDELNDSLAQKDNCLKEKVDSYLNLKAEFSELQDSLELQRMQIETLTVENTQYKNDLSQKGLEITSSITECDKLKQMLSDKNGKCDVLIQQIKDLEEINRNQNNELNDLKVSIKEQETSLLGKQDWLNTQLEEHTKLASQLQNTVLELNNTISGLQQSVFDKENTMQNLQEKYTSLHDHNQELAGALVKKEEEVSNILKVMNEKDSRLRMLESNVEAFISEVNCLKLKLDESKICVTSMSDSLKMKDEVISQHERTAKVVKVELEKLHIECQENKAQLHALAREKGENTSLTQSLQDKCAAQNQVIENLKHDLDNLNAKLLQIQSVTASEKEHFQQQLDATTQEKLDLENMLQLLQAEKENSLTVLERQLVNKTETIKELEEKLERQVKESEANILSTAEALNQLKGEHADLQKQVSEKAEENCALKLSLDNLSEQLQQSEQEFKKMSEQNAILREQNNSLENSSKVKLLEVEGLHKDLHFVEEQLCVICDEKSSEFDSCNSQYSNRVEKLSLMFCRALNYKTQVSELIKALESKDQELNNKSHSILKLEEESQHLQTELQKVKEEKLGSDYAVGELAAAKEALAAQQSLYNVKEEGLAQMNTYVATLQEEIRLNKESLQNNQLILSEEKAKVLELLDEVKEKTSVILNLNTQLSQQKEFISTLSDQIKEKDLSQMQIVESMSNEIGKYSEEKNMLSLELQNLQSEKKSCLSQISELSEKLKVSEIKLQEFEKVLAEKETFLNNLSNEKDLQLEKFNKERENLKRKLQAALVIRKDLMLKIEKLEQSKHDYENAEHMKVSKLEGMVEDLNRRLEIVLSENKDLQARLDICKQEILRRETETSELNKALSEKEVMFVELQNKVIELQNSFSEKESMCQEYMKIIQEKEHALSQAKSAMNKKIKTLEEENVHLVENLEVIKSCLEKALAMVESPVTDPQISSDPSVTNVPVNPESSSAEGSFLHSENSIVHNNVHASLLCSQGNVESKAKHTNLIDSLSKSIKQFELLQKTHVELQLAYRSQCAEHDQQRRQILQLENQIHAQQELLLSRELELSNKARDLDQLRQNTEETSHRLNYVKEHEDMICVLKASIQEKDEQLLSINSEHLQLLAESQSLKSEIQTLSSDVEHKQEEIFILRKAVESHSTDVEKYESIIETMKTDLVLMQKEIETSRKTNESIQQAIQEVTKEKNIYSDNCQANQVEIANLKGDLKLKSVELLEKVKELSTLKNSLEANVQTSEKLCNQLEERKVEANKLRGDYDQIKEELEVCISKLEKAHEEISYFRTKVNDLRKEEEIITQSSSVQVSYTDQVTPEAKATSVNLLGAKDYAHPACEDCFTKQKMIKELEQHAKGLNSAMEDLIKDQERRISEEGSSKEQIQRKLQAALVSRKDLIKEHKVLKQTIESLKLETGGLTHSLEEIQEKYSSEVALFTDKNKTLLSEIEGLSLDNENLSAACESLKSTMETIVQEKEAFSFQLNSLKDSQTVELTEWKAKHGELNKEYESLLQAYENISDEIDKMKQVIDLTKREKHEAVIKIQCLQNENQNMSQQAEENSKEIAKLKAMLDLKEEELRELKSEKDRLNIMAEKVSQVDDLTEKYQQLLEDNSKLQETCDNLKLCLENKEKENNSLFIIKTTLDKLQTDMNMYKSDMEIKISEMSSENEGLLKKITELSIKLAEAEQSLEKSEALKDNMSETIEQEKDARLELESDLSKLQVENINLEEKVKILEDDKALLLDEIENMQEQFCAVKNERESMEMELLNSVKNNSLLSDKFKSLQAQTNVLSQQVEYLRTEKNNVVREREEQQLKVLHELEEKVKSAQNDNRGTKSKSKELQELLKEKQHEINQLQGDSIRFQELILNLESTLKESNAQNEILKKELELSASQLTQFRNRVSFRENSLLDGANNQVFKQATEGETELTVDNETPEMKRHVSSTSSVKGLTRSMHKEHDVIVKDGRFDRKLNINGVETGYQVLELTEPLLELDQPSYQHGDESPRDELKALQGILSKREEECQQLKLECEKQVSISEHMKQIVHNKEKEISLLISLKDGGISSYLEHIQNQHRKEEEEYEQRLSTVQAQKEKSELECHKLEKDLQNVCATYEKAVSKNQLMSKDIEAFQKSMSSLQTNRDQLLSESQGIHQHNESLLNQKDIIISISAENSALKAEYRNVLNRIDDLNAENAMLGAQLIRYREHLNQVLALKDRQLKELLRQKLDHIKNLEQEKCDLEKQNRETQNANAALQSSAQSLQLNNQKLILKVKDQEDLIATLNKENIIFGSRKNDSIGSDDFQVKNETFNQNVVLSSESKKTAEKTSKTYLDILLENEKLKSQNESFGKAMATLQNNRDSLIDDFKELQWRYASELKTEKIRGDDLERELRDFKGKLYTLLTKNSLIDKTVFASENQITLEQLVAEMDSLCNLLSNRGSEITRLSSECATYAQQVDAFSKAMASLQHDRERLLQQLKDPNFVQGSRQSSSVKLPLESDSLSTKLLQSEPSQVTTLLNSSEESLKLRARVQDLERLQQEAKSFQEKLEREITGYQCELTELRSEKHFLVAEVQALHLQFSAALTDKDKQIADLGKSQEDVKLGTAIHEIKGLEKMALVGKSPSTGKINPILEDKEPVKQEVQRFIQEIQQRDLIIQQINAKAMESVEMNTVLSAQLKSVSQGLKDTQMKYSDLQNQYFKLQRDLQSSRVTNRSDLLSEVPPGAPQERSSVIVEMDNAELADLRRRLAETELGYEAAQQELSQLLERLAEERGRREAAEDALRLSEQQNQRLETKLPPRDYEFSVQMETDDEREALIIDPTQNVVVRKIKGGSLTMRRWLRGRSLYCSKLLTSRSKSRYLFLTYLLGLHLLVFMCLTGVL